jgi:hypothetical protein
MRGQYLYEPDPPSSTGPGGPLRRLLTSALLVSGLALLLFLVAPYIVRDTPPAEEFPTPTVPLPPATPTGAASATPTLTATASPLGTPAATPTPYAGFLASNLDQLDLKLGALHAWTNTNWILLASSSQLSSFVVDAGLQSKVQALNPVGVKMQVFVQAGDLCTQPYCQVSWVGIVFPTPEAAYQALMLFNVIYDSNAPELKLANSYASALPAASGLPTQDPTEKGTALSFCYVWKNMFIRISTLSLFYPSVDDIDQSYELVHEIFASWGRPTIP